MTSVWRIRMRKYKNQKEKKLAEIYCNGCGKKITIKNEIIQEGMFHGEILWGYFSNKDTEHHEFDLCEACYDRKNADISAKSERNEDKR